MAKRKFTRLNRTQKSGNIAATGNSGDVSNAQETYSTSGTNAVQISRADEVTAYSVLLHALRQEDIKFSNTGDKCDRDAGSFLLTFKEELLAPEELKIYMYIREHVRKSREQGASRIYPHPESVIEKFHLRDSETLLSWPEQKSALYEMTQVRKYAELFERFQKDNLKDGKAAESGLMGFLHEFNRKYSIQEIPTWKLTEADPRDFATMAMDSVLTHIPTFDGAWGGIAADENMSIIGSSGQGKTISLRILALLQAMNGKKVLFASGEAQPLKTLQVLLSSLSGHHWADYRRTSALEDLDQRDETFSELIKMNLEGQKSLKLIGGEIEVTGMIKSVHDLTSICDGMDRLPDVVVIDGVNVLAGTSHEKVEQVAEEISMWAVENLIPIIYNTQTNRNGIGIGKIPNTKDIASGMGYLQKSSIVLGVWPMQYFDELGQPHNGIALKELKLRDLGTTEIRATLLSILPRTKTIFSHDISALVGPETETFAQTAVKDGAGWMCSVSTMQGAAQTIFTKSEIKRMQEEAKISNSFMNALKSNHRSIVEG